MTESLYDYRMALKQEMIDLRHLELGSADCDLCRKGRGREMHEWVTRKMTVKQEAYRKASFQPAICSLLCPLCHANIAPTMAGKRTLLAFNVRLYGEKEVLRAIGEIPETFWRSILPDLFDLWRLRGNGGA